MKFNKNSLGNARKFYLDDAYFKNINTEEKAYWVGFLSADGCICVKNEHNKSLSVGLKIDDKGHLQKFLNCIKSNYKIYMQEDCCSISIASKILVDSLIFLGITPRKSMILEPCPNIPYNLLRHYFRGLVDGDGCIHKRNDGFYEVGLVGTKSICNYFCAWLCEENVKFRAKVIKIRNFYGIRFNGNQLPKKILSLLYKDSNIYLERKYKLAREIITI